MGWPVGDVLLTKYLWAMHDARAVGRTANQGGRELRPTRQRKRDVS